MTSRFFVGMAAVTGTLLVAGNALGQTPNFRMVWTVGGENTDYNWADINGQGPSGLGQLNGWGDWQVDGDPNFWTGWNYSGNLVGTFPQSGNDWDRVWECVFNDSVEGVATGGGAFVIANIVVTNSDINTQSFALLMSLPVSRAIPNPLERGSIVGTVTDLTFDDATVSAIGGGQIYTPRIDTIDEAPGFLMGGGFAETAGGPLQSNVVGPADFGVPVLVAGSQNVDTSIAIRLNFNLSPGDSASFTAIFEVLVPGAGALPLLSAFGLLTGRRRRR